MSNEAVTSEFPFHFAHTHMGADELARHNRRHHLTGASRAESATKAVERIRTQRSATMERVHAWLRHPDDRVVAAALTQRYLPLVQPVLAHLPGGIVLRRITGRPGEMMSQVKRWLLRT